MEKQPNFLEKIDISEISIDKLQRRYLDYRLYHFIGGIIPPFSYISKDREGNRIAEDAEYAMDRLRLKYQLDTEWQVRIIEGKTVSPIICIIADIVDNSKMVITDMEKVGYFPSYQEKLKKNNTMWLKIQFEPLYPYNDIDDIRKFLLAYSWVPSYDIKNVFKNGFLPNPKTYFLRENSFVDDIKRYGKKCCLKNKDVRNDGNYKFVVIDTRKIPKNVVFCKDDNEDNVLYTYDFIPRSAIDKEMTEDYLFPIDNTIKQENSEE